MSAFTKYKTLYCFFLLCIYNLIRKNYSLQQFGLHVIFANRIHMCYLPVAKGSWGLKKALISIVSFLSCT